jgi:hypothetical protein
LNRAPVRDEADHSRREYTATLENIEDVAWRLAGQYELPEGWESEVYSWLSEYRPGSLENRDGRGGTPSEKAIRDAFDGVGYRRIRG